jgi:Mrp family chromosome partitioning ATPase
MKVYRLNQQSKAQNTIAIMSSKGGVGKSTITALLATHLTRIGKKVGILDADIIGPTISRLFAIQSKVVGQDGLILPITSPLGIRLISSQLLLDQSDDPIVWRSPLVLDLIRQFYVDVIWGDLDYLFIDLPPGTGDVSMTVLESLNVDNIIMVTTPQDIVQDIVGKGIQMAKMVNKPILGIIENYSYFICDQCQKKHPLFHTSNRPTIWQKYQLPLLAQLPLDSQLPKLIDNGKIETIDMDTIRQLVQSWRQ